MEGTCIWKELASDRNQTGEQEAGKLAGVLNPESVSSSLINKKANPQERPRVPNVCRCRAIVSFSLIEGNRVPSYQLTYRTFYAAGYFYKDSGQRCLSL